MDIKQIKFRQLTRFKKFHYWGYARAGYFIGPMTDKEPNPKHDMYFGKDKNGNELYENDIFYHTPTGISFILKFGMTDNLFGWYLLEMSDKPKQMKVCFSITESTFNDISDIFFYKKGNTHGL